MVWQRGRDAILGVIDRPQEIKGFRTGSKNAKCKGA